MLRSTGNGPLCPTTGGAPSRPGPAAFEEPALPHLPERGRKGGAEDSEEVAEPTARRGGLLCGGASAAPVAEDGGPEGMALGDEARKASGGKADVAPRRRAAAPAQPARHGLSAVGQPATAALTGSRFC